MDARAERAGKNEAVFREVNERISDVNTRERRRVPLRVRDRNLHGDGSDDRGRV